jgi:hypothetical protein
MASEGGPDAAGHGNLVQVHEWVRFYDNHYHRVVRFMMHNGASPDEGHHRPQPHPQRHHGAGQSA